MTEGPILKNVIAYTLPIIFTGILQLLFNAADMIVVGRFCGSVCVGAVGATGALINLLINLFIGLSVGAGVTVAHAVGANDHQAIHQAVHTAILTSIISGVILTAVGIPLAGKLLAWMDTPADVLPLSTLYMRIYFGGILSTMVYNFGAAVMRAMGDTRSPLYFLLFSGVINVLLNLLFVLVFKMTVDGVAWATVASQTVSAFLVVRALSKRGDSGMLSFRALKIHPKALISILKIGVPAGLQSIMFNISNVFIQSSVNSFQSVDVVSGNASAANIEGFVYVSMNAFNQTAMNFTGQNVGAGKLKRLPKILGCCLLCVSAFGIVLGVSGFLAGRPLLSIYITDSEQAIEYGMIRLRYICLVYFLCGLMDVITGAIRGMGYSFTPMCITVLGVCVMRIVWILTVFRNPAWHTLDVLYLSYPISWIISAIAQTVAFFILYRLLCKKHATPEAELLKRSTEKN